MGGRPPKPSKSTADDKQRFFYYASGKQIELTPDEQLVAVDQERASGADISAAARKQIKDVSQPLRGNVTLVSRQKLSPAARGALEDAKALQPVFHAAGAMIVALPEVRIEDSSPARLKALRKWLKMHADEAEVVSDDGDRLVLRPLSGTGKDALKLANALTEQVDIETAQPRFLRVVRSPGKEG